MYDIIPVSGFRYGATIYPTEAEATKAALNDLAIASIARFVGNFLEKSAVTAAHNALDISARRFALIDCRLDNAVVNAIGVSLVSVKNAFHS